MTAMAKRQELKGYIDAMADDSVFVVEPILSMLARMGAQAQRARADYVVESNLTDEEKKIILDGAREYKEHPENFTAMEEIDWT